VIAGLGPAAPALEWVIAASAGVYHAAAAGVAWLRAPALLAVLGLLGVCLARRRPVSGPTRLWICLALGWIAQAYLADARLAIAAAVYLVAAGAYAFRREAPQPLDTPLLASAELVGYAAAFGLFILLALYRLDVHPRLYFDEVAYLTAARMQRGELAPGPISIPPLLASPSYGFERLQAQSVPLLLQVVALEAPLPPILAIRLVSVLTALVALALAALAVRRAVGPAPALWMTALASVSPLLLAYSRPGFFFSASLLHAAATLAAVLRLARRPERGSAVLLGLLLGSTPYFYQLSWLVPPMAGAAWLAARPSRPARRTAALAAPLAASALLALSPAAIWLRPGFQAVGKQTLDLAARPSGPLERAHVVHEHPEELPELLPLWGRLAAAGVRADQICAGERVEIGLVGSHADLSASLRELQKQGWVVRSLCWTPPYPLRDLWLMASQLLVAPGCDVASRPVREPGLPPLLTPLILLGGLEILRRRRQPALRAIGVWVCAALVLPALSGGPALRRALLIFPFVYAWAALPLLDAIRSARTPARRATARAGAALLLAAALPAGIHGYFGRWYVDLPTWDALQTARPSARQHELFESLLELGRALRALPRDVPVVLEPLFRGDRIVLERTSGERLQRDGGRLIDRHDRRAPARRRVACALDPPFVWVAPDTPSARGQLERLGQDFQTRREAAGPFLLEHVSRRRPGGCP
jgi:hypothetical protein